MLDRQGLCGEHEGLRADDRAATENMQTATSIWAVALYTEGGLRPQRCGRWRKPKRSILKNQRARYYEGPLLSLAIPLIRRQLPHCDRWHGAIHGFRQIHDDLGWLLLIQHQYAGPRAPRSSRPRWGSIRMM